MTDHQIPYGADSALTLRIDPHALIGHCGIPKMEPADEDIGLLVEQALAHPTGYPSLREAVLPDDFITITVDHEVPHASPVVAGIVGTLLKAGAVPAKIHVLLGADGEGADSMRQSLRDAGFERIDVGTHDPRNRSAVAYLAADGKGRPVYLNRLVCDADLVISVGCLRATGSPAYWGIHAGIYPEFADADTHQRFKAPSSSLSRPRTARRVHEAEEASWLLGARFTVQVIPGPNGSVTAIMAGDVDAVRKLGGQRVDALWMSKIPGRASLVVAALSGGPCQQTWENVGRVMSSALEAADEDGSIVLCTQVQRSPGPSLRRVGRAVNPRQVHKLGEKHPTSDSVFASQLAKAQRTHRVYFLSRLHSEAVEDLGMTPISNPHEIQNLCDRSSSCLLISNAQYCRPSIHALPIPVGKD